MRSERRQPINRTPPSQFFPPSNWLQSNGLSTLFNRARISTESDMIPSTPKGTWVSAEHRDQDALTLEKVRAFLSCTLKLYCCIPSHNDFHCELCFGEGTSVYIERNCKI